MGAKLSNNFSLKIFSMIVAVVLYIFVSAESSTPIEVEFPIEYRTQEGIVVVGDSPTRIRTTLQGPWANFRSFKIDSMTPVVVNIANETEANTIRHTISSGDIEPPGGMKIIAFSPSEWTIDIDLKVERLVNVNVDLPGRPALGFEIVDVQIEPAQVRVAGPQREVEMLQYVRTRAIDVSEREGDLEIEVELRAPPHPIVLRQKMVQAKVQIGEEFVRRTFRDVSVKVVNGPATSNLKSPDITFILKGPRRVVDKIDKDTLEAFVDVSEDVKAGKTDFEKVVQFKDLPERTQVVAPKPKVAIRFP